MSVSFKINRLSEVKYAAYVLTFLLMMELYCMIKRVEFDVFVSRDRRDIDIA